MENKTTNNNNNTNTINNNRDNHDDDDDNDGVKCITMRVIHVNDKLYERLRILYEFYEKEFMEQPQFFVRVPGRVNIIGEHVDYCGYPVLPMAIEQCILLAVGRNNNQSILQLRNLNREQFADYTCSSTAINIERLDCNAPNWYNYYLCGIKGIYERLDGKHEQFGMNIILDGNIPIASGVSSSSAIVSGSVLATAYMHNLQMDRKQLADISAQCERYIGTQGGGMDQAIAYLAQEGCAQFIEFVPRLKASSLQLPANTYFVVANSLSPINKAATSDFNERVVECRLGCRLIAHYKQLPEWKAIVRYRDLQNLLDYNLKQLENLIYEYLPQHQYSRHDLLHLFKVDEEEFITKFLTPNTLHMQTFKLQQRALHVIQESLRVEEFRRICLMDDKEISETVDMADTTDINRWKLKRLSDLMKQSHYSLKHLYECSHPLLDKLVELSQDYGIGARLTGAGWGGCIVALCDSIDSSRSYMEMLKEKYYNLLPDSLRATHQADDYCKVIFATSPQQGAEILLLA